MFGLVANLHWFHNKICKNRVWRLNYQSNSTAKILKSTQHHGRHIRVQKRTEAHLWQGQRVSVAYQELDRMKGCKSTWGSKRDVQLITWIVKKNKIKKTHKITAAQLTAELNTHLNSHVSTKTVHRELHVVNIHCRAAIAKPSVTRANVRCRFHWCQQWKSWAVDNVKHCSLMSPSSLSFPHRQCGKTHVVTLYYPILP